MAMAGSLQYYIYGGAAVSKKDIAVKKKVFPYRSLDLCRCLCDWMAVLGSILQRCGTVSKIQKRYSRGGAGPFQIYPKGPFLKGESIPVVNTQYPGPDHFHATTRYQDSILGVIYTTAQKPFRIG